MVAVADMLNHAPGAGGGHISWDGKFFQVNATKDYADGEEVFLNYGPKSNFELLRNYGFLLENNPDDSLILQFRLSSQNVIHGIVEPLIRAIQYVETSRVIFLTE